MSTAPDRKRLLAEISGGFGASGPPGIAAAGLMIGVIFVLLSLTNLTAVLRHIFVPPVVRGSRHRRALLRRRRRGGVGFGGDWQYLRRRPGRSRAIRPA
jgi:hypothetical protein